MFRVPTKGVLFATISTLALTGPAHASSRVGRDRASIETLSTALELYRQDTGDYPSTEEGLEVLLRSNESAPNGYVKTLSTNAWGSEFQYRYPGARNAGGFDLWSLGRDGLPGGAGFDSDCGNWPDGFAPCFEAERRARLDRLYRNLPTNLSAGAAFGGVVYLLSCVLGRLAGVRGRAVFAGRHAVASAVAALLISLILVSLD